jgi:hypothetical protein
MDIFTCSADGTQITAGRSDGEGAVAHSALARWGTAAASEGEGCAYTKAARREAGREEAVVLATRVFVSRPA